MPGMWSRAAALAADTPPQRNKAVDFLRAASITAVVLGHWLMAAIWVDADGTHASHLLALSPWTQWLTWAFQVMPVFFFVGGYANGVSWDSALRTNQSYRDWLYGRIGRLCRPVFPLLLFWAAAAWIARAAGVPAEMIRIASITALVPTWFLAVYFLVVILAPLAHAAWRRFGMATFWAPAAVAAVLDLLFFGAGVREPGWANYFFIWIAVHQLGFAWRAGRFSARGMALAWCLAGLAALIAMTEFGPWPRSLVGVPGEEISNTTPPHLPLLPLAAFQFGAVMLIENRLRRWLKRPAPWTTAVLLNGTIMTLFLWHSGSMMLSYGLSIWLGGIGLGLIPGSAIWWAMRPLWVLIFLAMTMIFLSLFARLERGSRASASAPHPARMICGLLVGGAGIGQLAMFGIGGDGPGGLRLIPLLLALGGMITALAPGPARTSH